MAIDNKLIIGLGLLLGAGVTAQAQEIEEVVVWSKAGNNDLTKPSPSQLILPQDLLSINATTTEDLVKFAPSLVVRRRFIGDSNGTLGIRGSNMFQTSRSMVFADGVPLHYLLQSRWNGAPRWSLVSASEIAQVEVLYGPFSAEYSGNAMGGVVEIETAIPQQREFHADITGFVQEFDDYGFDDEVAGGKGFVSYGDKIGNFSFYTSLNHLDNTSQPQTFRGSKVGSGSGTEVVVNNAIHGPDSRGGDYIYYGDTGVVDTQTDNYKIKLGYELDNWQALLNLAFEDRESDARSANSYLKDLNGNTVWSGSNLVSNGQHFSLSESRLNESLLERQSLSAGLRIRGDLTDSAQLEFNINRFDILKDTKRSSDANPQDSAYDGGGEVQDFDNSGWKTVEVKLKINDLAVEGLDLVSGLRYEKYTLNLDVFNSDDYLAASKSSFKSRFGGSTKIFAAFTQAHWKINEMFDLGFGLRYEDFKSFDGYYSDDDSNTSEFDLVDAPETKASKTSPKFSIGFRPNDNWLARYSIAKAYRFPIVEELFSQYKAFNVKSLSNPELKPEDGAHHNLMLERQIDDGYLRVNLFYETVKNAIESQTTEVEGVSVRTFVPIDKTKARGVEFIAQQNGIFVPELDISFNLTFTRATIEENAAKRTFEGNTYPRMPKWRSNLLATYHFNSKWNAGVNLQYASNSYGRLENDDLVSNVYGAQDKFTRLGFKTNYQIDKHLKANFGVDNLTNEIAYVAHPWPGRTYYLGLAYDL